VAEKFDAYARDYEALHKTSIASSGEDPSYFRDYKIDCLARRGLLDGPVLDYGCGVGNLTERLVGKAPEVHGYDPSAESRTEAAARAGGAVIHETAETLPRDHFETAILSGVLHHIRPEERGAILAEVRRALRPGGRIVVFEHNPLNPLTVRAVKACEFDDDAVLLWPWTARRTLERADFTGVTLDYIVFFPRQLAFLRRFEPRLRRLALGAQQMLIGTRR
jgi:SAM-dependent methyltransferase